jgi:molybdenum cofactor cytidylyltransferase
MINAGKVAAVLLAAGQSRRFGAADKLLADLDGEPLVTRAARRIVELGPGRRIAVCGSADDVPAKLLTAQGFDIVPNPYPERGLSHSLALGIAEAAAGPEQAALVCLADMPFVRLAHLEALLARFDAGHIPVVASARAGIAMPPALFARALFDRLREMKGDRGAREMLASAQIVEAPAAELADVDLPDDLRR